MIDIKRATLRDIPLIHRIAAEVWPVTYSHLMSEEQLDYMFDMMYSPVSLEQQMTVKGHNYFILFDNDIPQGYISVHIVDDTILYLEKIYVLPTAQGKGFGAMLLDRAEKFAALHSLNSIRLNVNRVNKSRFFYERQGFKIISQRDVHIGQGYYMNDYIMEKELLNN
jgi:ribosomal protein S18 acetylase RimI-like enzyme